MNIDSRRMDRPSIVLVTNTLEGGGAERVLTDMAGYWAGKGWHVTLATWNGPEVEDFYVLPSSVNREWLDVQSPSHSTFAKVRANIGRILKLRRLLLRVRPDAVLSFIDVSNVQTILATRGLRCRVVISERNNPDQTDEDGAYADVYTLARPWRILRRLVYRWADWVTALNTDAAEWIKRECHVEAEVIPNPLRPLPCQVSERECLILAVGRLTREKGFDLLLQAFARISDEFPGWRLLIIGKGPEEVALKELRKKLNLASRVDFKGPVKDIETWMARAGLIVLPSRFEAYGNAALESLGMGAPVISTSCSGPSSFIKDGLNGCLVPIEDIDALSCSMAKLLADPCLRLHLGQEAVKVRETHRQEVVMRQWETCLLSEIELN